MSLSEHQHFDRIFIQFSAILQNRFDKLQLNTFPYHRIPHCSLALCNHQLAICKI